MSLNNFLPQDPVKICLRIALYATNDVKIIDVNIFDEGPRPNL